MKRDMVIEAAERELRACGYATVLAGNVRTFADVFAEGRCGKFIIKAVRNIDSVTRSEADALSRLSQFMGAEPLVVGEASKNSRLKSGVSYYRFSVRCVSPDTLSDALSGDPSLLASKSVGLKARIDGNKLRRLRQLADTHVPELARMSRLSISTLYKHERGTQYAAIVTVAKLEKALSSSITAAEGPEPHGVGHLPTGRFERTGMSALRLSNAPFDLVAKDRNYFEISMDANSRTLAKRAAFFSALRETFENNYPFFISDRRKCKVIGVPVIGKKELAGIKSEDELLELVY